MHIRYFRISRSIIRTCLLVIGLGLRATRASFIRLICIYSLWWSYCPHLAKLLSLRWLSTLSVTSIWAFANFISTKYFLFSPRIIPSFLRQACFLGCSLSIYCILNFRRIFFTCSLKTGTKECTQGQNALSTINPARRGLGGLPHKKEAYKFFPIFAGKLGYEI